MCCVAESGGRHALSPPQRPRRATLENLCTCYRPSTALPLLKRRHDSSAPPPGPSRPARPRSARIALPWILLATLVLPLTGGQALGQQASEHELKAIFLLKLLRFVEWPEEHQPSEDRPLTLTVLGKDPFGSKLDRVFAKQKINGHHVVIRRAKTLAELPDSHVVFISSSLKDRLPEITKELDQRPLLPVGDSSKFAANGGMLGLLIEDKRLKFEVNLASTKRCELTLSSQLLRLARKVVR